MQQTIWNEDIKMPQYPSLSGDCKTDVLIVGGGMCGLLCAYFLSWKGLDYCMVDAGRIGEGITGKTTAKISVLQGFTYQNIMQKLGRDAARLYLESNESALERYANIAQNVDCDFRRKTAYTYTMKDREKPETEVRTIRSLGGNAELVSQTELPFATLGAVKMKKQAEFHPLKFIRGISRGLHLYENTRIKNITGKKAVYDRGTITAKKIILTTHFPFLDRIGGFYLKLYQNRSYTLALKNAPRLHGMYVNGDGNGVSARSQGEYMLLSGGAHRTGRKCGGWRELQSFASHYFPYAKENFAWAAQDCMSLDGLSYVGRYSALTPDYYVATGFNKWGMTASMSAAMLLRDLILERDNEMEKILSPQRSIWHRQLFCNAGEVILDFFTPTVKRCPHLGCALKWNAAEHSWDCPCHGSRFSEKGALLENPANLNLAKTKE